MAGPPKRNVKEPSDYFEVPVQNGHIIQTALICSSVLFGLVIILVAVIHCWKGQRDLAELAASVKDTFLYLHNGLLMLIGYATLYGWIVTNVVSGIWKQIQNFSLGREKAD